MYFFCIYGEISISIYLSALDSEGQMMLLLHKTQILDILRLFKVWIVLILKL